jgi:two-component system OmpR family response regulator
MQKNPETGVIHVVDDDSDIAKIASIALQHAGYYVHSFSDPAEALKDIELVCGKKVRMLITDLRMPGHNGFEVAKRTRAVVPDVPVIFMTAVDVNSDEFGRILPSFKVNAFLQKPFRIEKLLNVVREHLN